MIVGRFHRRNSEIPEAIDRYAVVAFAPTPHSVARSPGGEHCRCSSRSRVWKYTCRSTVRVVPVAPNAVGAERERCGVYLQWHRTVITRSQFGRLCYESMSVKT